MPPRPFTATDVPGLTSTAAAQPPNPPPVPDAYAEGYAAGVRAASLAAAAYIRSEANRVMSGLDRAGRAAFARPYSALHTRADAIERGEHLATPAPDPTADKAQLAALGSSREGQRGDQG